MCTDLFPPTFVLSRTKWASFSSEHSCTQSLSSHKSSPLSRRHWRRDVQEQTRLVTELPLHFYYQTPLIMSHSSPSIFLKLWHRSLGMESSLTLNPHHAAACTRNMVSNFFIKDTVSVHLVTLWAHLPVIYDECRQIRCKFHLRKTQISLCFANSDPEKREFSTFYPLKGCFAWPGHSPVFLNTAAKDLNRERTFSFPQVYLLLGKAKGMSVLLPCCLHS